MQTGPANVEELGICDYVCSPDQLILKEPTYNLCGLADCWFACKQLQRGDRCNGRWSFKSNSTWSIAVFMIFPFKMIRFAFELCASAWDCQSKDLAPLSPVSYAHLHASLPFPNHMWSKDSHKSVSIIQIGGLLTDSGKTDTQIATLAKPTLFSWSFRKSRKCSLSPNFSELASLGLGSVQKSWRKWTLDVASYSQINL